MAKRLGEVYFNGKVLSNREIVDMYDQTDIPDPFIELTQSLLGDAPLASLARECTTESPLIRYSHACNLGAGETSGELYLLVEYGSIVEYLIEADLRPMLAGMFNGTPLDYDDKSELIRLTRAIAKDKFYAYSNDERKVYLDGYVLKIHHTLPNR